MSNADFKSSTIVVNVSSTSRIVRVADVRQRVQRSKGENLQRRMPKCQKKKARKEKVSFAFKDR